MNLSTLIHSLSDLIQQKKALERQLKEIAEGIALIESDIMHSMDDEGIQQSICDHMKVKISEATYPHVENWDQFYDFIYENRYFHLLEKRPTAVGYRELRSLNQKVPGVVPFVKRKLSFTEV